MSRFMALILSERRTSTPRIVFLRNVQQSAINLRILGAAGARIAGLVALSRVHLAGFKVPPTFAAYPYPEAL